MPLRVAENDDIIRVESNFTLSRKEFGVGSKSWILSDKVKAQVQFTVRKP